MERHTISERPNWREKVEGIGLTYHSHEDGPYWDETGCYELTAEEVNRLEKAGNDLHALCIEAAATVIDKGWWYRLGISENAVPSILDSWERDDWSLYGRFDLAFDGVTAPKMLEYNADTPTALVEAAVAQWFWLEECRPGMDQFNSIHERLIEAWRHWAGRRVHFSSVQENAEDEQTVSYLRDTAEQAGVLTSSVYIEDIGWDGRAGAFVDLHSERIETAFKLYPWEWLWAEDFGKSLSLAKTHWIEPPWKMLFSNKGILPVLWELFPGHPNLLPAYDSPEFLGGTFVKKPKLSREGANVTWVERGHTVESTTGLYEGGAAWVYQAPARLGTFKGQHPVFGVWMIDQTAAGVGIREEQGLITNNRSRFVPHFFKPEPRV